MDLVFCDDKTVEKLLLFVHYRENLAIEKSWTWSVFPTSLVEFDLIASRNTVCYFTIFFVNYNMHALSYAINYLVIFPKHSFNVSNWGFIVIKIDDFPVLKFFINAIQYINKAIWRVSALPNLVVVLMKQLICLFHWFLQPILISFLSFQLQITIQKLVDFVRGVTKYVKEQITLSGRTRKDFFAFWCDVVKLNLSYLGCVIETCCTS